MASIAIKTLTNSAVRTGPIVGPSTTFMGTGCGVFGRNKHNPVTRVMQKMGIFPTEADPCVAWDKGLLKKKRRPSD